MVHLLKEVDQLEPDERPAKRQKISRNIQKAHDISMLFDKEVRKLLLCPKEEAANKFWDANSEIMNANKINREDYKRGSMTNHPGGKLNTIVTMNWNLLFVTEFVFLCLSFCFPCLTNRLCVVGSTNSKIVNRSPPVCVSPR
jgi:hypothetical protein